ncbi:MAG: hypothetical protein ACI8TA_002299 [Cyclobacteriaceae bacterium]
MQEKAIQKKKIIFLGDDENSYLEEFGVEHICFESYKSSDLIDEFNSVFKVIAGKEHQYAKNRGTDYWIKFVFLRWFLIYEFIKDQNIKRFWTFDTDNMLVGDLSKVEPELAKYDCTAQCV